MRQIKYNGLTCHDTKLHYLSNGVSEKTMLPWMSAEFVSNDMKLLKALIDSFVSRACNSHVVSFIPCYGIVRNKASGHL